MDSGARHTPGLQGVLETAIYVDDLEKAEQFYGGVLGLPKIFAAPGRQLVFSCQESILLVFNPEHTEREQVVINGGACSKQRPFFGSPGRRTSAPLLPHQTRCEPDQNPMRPRSPSGSHRVRSESSRRGA